MLFTQAMQRRFSCRTYRDEPIDESLQRVLSEFLAKNGLGPLGTRARFALIAASDRDRDSLKGLGTYGFIKNPKGFIVGAAERGTKDLEDFGYLMEQAILIATDLGLGTCWLGGSFSKSSFAKKIGASRMELVPAVTAVGYAVTDSQSKDWIRKRAGASRRLPAELLFFDRKFGEPLALEPNDMYRDVLDAVRWAPSASNKQPWRIVRNGQAFHFYLERTKGYGKGSLLFLMLQIADLQRVDMGVAMCHFELAARDLGLRGRWVIDDPGIDKPNVGTEYTVSWVGES